MIVAGTTADIDDTLATTRRLILVCALVAAALAALLATLPDAPRAAPACAGCPRARGRSSAAATPPSACPPAAAATRSASSPQTLNAMLASLERARAAEQRFVADASHELRTPLTALRGNAAYVARHGADPAVLADIEADAARLSALLDDLLALAREDAAAPADRRAGRARGDRPRGRGGRSRAPTSSSSPAPARVAVLGERLALERAVSNLVRNARAHGPPGGRITVTVAPRRRPRARSASPTRARPRRRRARARLRALLARPGRARRGLGPRAWRSCARSPSATAGACGRRRALHDRAAGSQRSLKIRAYNSVMRRLRTHLHPPPAHDPRLRRRRSSQPPRSPRPRSAASGPVRRPEGARRRRSTTRSARPSPTASRRGSTFTNNLLPVRLAAGRVASPLISGADGRLWLDEGRRASASSCSPTPATRRSPPTASTSRSTTAPRTPSTGRRCPSRAPSDAARQAPKHENPTLAKIQDALDRLAKFWTVSGADPTSTAGQPTYTRADLAEGRRRPARRGRARLGRRHRRAAARRGLRAGPGRPGARARGDRDLLRRRARLRRRRRRRPAGAKVVDLSPTQPTRARAAGRERDGARASTPSVERRRRRARRARLPARRARRSSPACRARSVRLVERRRRARARS